MLYTEDFTMRHYVGFSQIGSHISSNIVSEKVIIIHCSKPVVSCTLYYCCLKITKVDGMLSHDNNEVYVVTLLNTLAVNDGAKSNSLMLKVFQSFEKLF